MDKSQNDEKSSEPILFHADGTLIKIIKSWKEYPLDQWFRELTIGRTQQAFFKPPSKDICGGEFQKVLLAEYGWILRCDICGQQMPLVSHQVFWTNYQQLIHVV